MVGGGRKGSGITSMNYLCSRPTNGAVGNNRILLRIQMDDVTVRARQAGSIFCQTLRAN